MIISEFSKGYKGKITLCLGCFDAVHLGHKALIDSAADLASKSHSMLAVFTFLSPLTTSNKLYSPFLLTFDERCKKLEELGASLVVTASFDETFKSLSAEKFFSILTENFDIKNIVCGFDYKFGYKASGDVELLRALCLQKGIGFSVTEKQAMFSEKISSSSIKKYLSFGNVERANAMLGYVFSVENTVIGGRNVGSGLGFPTANTEYPNDKFQIKQGVYATHVLLGGKIYHSITNFGGCPTFNVEKIIMETYIDDFSGSLYGKPLRVYFDFYIRDIVAFKDKSGLIQRLNKDIEISKGVKI